MTQIYYYALGIRVLGKKNLSLLQLRRHDVQQALDNPVPRSISGCVHMHIRCAAADLEFRIRGLLDEHCNASYGIQSVPLLVTLQPYVLLRRPFI